MGNNTQFSIAVHVLAGLGARGAATPSGALAKSVNACPSFVRRVMSKLAKANLVRTTTGKSGSCALARNPRDISLLDVYRAVEGPKAFAIHDYPEQRQCAVSCGIKPALQKVLDKTQSSMEESLRTMSLADVLTDLKV
ncbi:MAG: Rrf2 family transcriptional regulator [Elusimicrobiota bacterium]